MLLEMTLLVALVGQSQPASSQSSVLVTKTRRSDEVMLWGQGTEDGAMYEYSVSKADFAKLPPWDVDRDPPPLAISRALEIAKKATRAEHPEFVEFMPWTISINHVGSGNRQSRWFYVLSMYPMANGEPSVESQVTVVVLMDGTVVKPKLRKAAK